MLPPIHTVNSAYVERLTNFSQWKSGHIAALAAHTKSLKATNDALETKLDRLAVRRIIGAAARSHKQSGLSSIKALFQKAEGTGGRDVRRLVARRLIAVAMDRVRARYN
jgi:hypothetical protein